MLPIRTRSVFKSRWVALLWAGGILWTAIDFAGSRPQGDAASNDQSNAEAADVQAAVNALEAVK